MALSALLTPTLSDYHWLRRHLHGSLHRSCVAVVYPTRALTYLIFVANATNSVGVKFLK